MRHGHLVPSCHWAGQAQLPRPRCAAAGLVPSCPARQRTLPGEGRVRQRAARRLAAAPLGTASPEKSRAAGRSSPPAGTGRGARSRRRAGPKLRSPPALGCPWAPLRESPAERPRCVRRLRTPVLSGVGCGSPHRVFVPLPKGAAEEGAGLPGRQRWHGGPRALRLP